MAKWVALLRGVNVGGKNKIPMEQLRAACASAGLKNVQSYIQSGNLVFDTGHTADQTAKTLHTILTEQFNIIVPILVWPAAALTRALATCPFPESPGNLAHGYFCFSPPVLNDAKYQSLRIISEEVQVVGHVIWLHAPDGVGQSKLARQFESIAPGTIMTGRNLNTIRKLAEMLDG